MDTPQIVNVLFAGSAGHFVLVLCAADGPVDATETEQIQQGPEGRAVDHQ